MHRTLRVEAAVARSHEAFPIPKVVRDREASQNPAVLQKRRLPIKIENFFRD